MAKPTTVWEKTINIVWVKRYTESSLPPSPDIVAQVKLAEKKMYRNITLSRFVNVCSETIQNCFVPEGNIIVFEKNISKCVCLGKLSILKRFACSRQKNIFLISEVFSRRRVLALDSKRQMFRQTMFYPFATIEFSSAFLCWGLRLYVPHNSSLEQWETIDVIKARFLAYRAKLSQFSVVSIFENLFAFN